jgi:hypothetical protein
LGELDCLFDDLGGFDGAALVAAAAKMSITPSEVTAFQRIWRMAVFYKVMLNRDF